ncbi:MAG: hypothetical protein RLZZ77_923 [Bacteroidota bacterium]
MKTKLLLFSTLLALYIPVQSQILTTDPPFPTMYDDITIFYDADLGNGELAGVFPLFAHTGCITQNSSNLNDWQHVQGNWGTSDPNVAMTPVSIAQNTHRITINPSTFYGLNNGEIPTRLTFVFRNSNGTLVGRNADGTDIYLELYDSGFNAAFVSPNLESQIVNSGQLVSISAQASEAADLSLLVNGTEVSSASASTSLQYNFQESASGEYVLELVANNGTETITDTATIIILPTPNVVASPSGTIDGINYVGANTVRLQLYAPNKDFVFVIGDFNNWQLDLDYLMNRTPDGATYWIEIPNLDPSVEYRFQYYIDQEGMRIADPYTEKVLDPWNDQWIPEANYPNMTGYPVGLTTEPVGVFQINQPNFSWTDGGFTRPAKNKIVVYECLVRDFTEERSYQAIIDRLDYIENLGITVLQLMPVNEFEGNDSWGYNPSFYFAPDKMYGPADKLKELVNECHNRGIAVVLDIALNHSFGQSPMVRMYFDPNAGQYGQTTAENPWFNPTPKHDFNVGYDMNHESARTRAFTKRVISHWMDEYHIDGYRFDLSKGFTQNNTLGNIGAWNAYDASRVAIWNDYYSHMQTTEPGSYCILEHLSDNPEETVLANTGMMPWGKMTTQYEEASMGYSSDLTWASYQARGWSQPHLISYGESHDEERLMYKNLNFGNSNGSYDVQNLNTALARQELAHNLLIPIPGPHMIWQFGELGYDYSINTCSDGVTISPDCRTAAKPVRWDYFEAQARLRVYKVVSALNKLKRDYQTFSTTNYTTDLGGFGKRMTLDGSTMDAVIVGNFNVVGINMVPGFSHTGTWYDYYTGTSFQVTDLNNAFAYTPGEYHIYTDVQLPAPDLSTSIEEVMQFAGASIMAYPNPTQDRLTVNFEMTQAGKVQVELFDLTGRKVADIATVNLGTGIQQVQIDLASKGLQNGEYLVRVQQPNTVLTTLVMLSR